MEAHAVWIIRQNRRRANEKSAALSEQVKIFVAGNSRRFEIVANDENWNFTVSRNHDRSRDAGFHIRTVAAFLPRELKTGREKDALQSFPVNWRELGHGRSSRHGWECFSMPIQSGLRHSAPACS